jgi:CubicO group peptidase (beta-lactamase class C family)
MNRFRLIPWVLAGLGPGALTIPALASVESAAGSPEACFTAPDAQARQDRVAQGLLPRVMFSGETAPAPVQARMAEHRVPAFSVAVIRAGTLDWSAAWGRQQADGAATTCRSLFQAGSLAKPATVLAAWRMQQAGAIDLDADVDAYLTPWKLPAGRQNAEHPVTLRHLFAHTAGITPGGYEGYPRNAVLPTDLQTAQGLPPSNARKAEVLAVPGTTLRYSGPGYTVAEIALQQHFKRPFESLMRTWLTGPVGMRHADFSQPAPRDGEEHVARGHQGDGQPVPGGWHAHPEQAAAGLWATPADLAALLIELRKGWLGTSTVFAQASVHDLLARPFEEHAYGFRLIGDGEQVFLTHYGGTVGYRAGMTLNLRSGDGAVFMANADSGMDLGMEFFAAVSDTYGWSSFGPTRVERAATPPADVLQSLAGRYGFEDGPVVEVVPEAGVLTLVFPNGDRYPLSPIKGLPRAFIHADTGVRASFDGEGEATTIQLYGDTGRRVR